jgi:hypothetical protein
MFHSVENDCPTVAPAEIFLVNFSSNVTAPVVVSGTS